MSNTLAQYFTLHRRYSRSVNLDRDHERSEALEGYILTKRAKDALYRIGSHIARGAANGSWTLTSVYGTGKSAFSHFLIALCAPIDHPMRQKALLILSQSYAPNSSQPLPFQENFPPSGYLRAVATGTREPISYTVIRALIRGVETFWTETERQNIPIIAKLTDKINIIKIGNKIENREVIQLVLEVGKAAKTGIFLVLDELGKNLEFAAYNSSKEDLYLLQEISEISTNSQNPVYILGILHQAFSDYGQRLGNLQRNEWSKIQGRFEDIPFTESAGEMMRLIAEAIKLENAEHFEAAINYQSVDLLAVEWFQKLSSLFQGQDLSHDILRKVYPLHPLTALILPTLCNRYAQNDRSLFTFLTSDEPFSFKTFLDETEIEDRQLPSLKLDRVYDYFIETAGVGLASRSNLQRWVEIQDLITDAKYLEDDWLRVLKIIGILNLVTTTGNTRATRQLVKLAISNFPSNAVESKYWDDVIEKLKQKGLITHFRQLDELRLWQGSDFNVDLALNNELQQQRDSLVSLISNIYPLVPDVAQRHSYKTGTLRYFERIYLEDSRSLKELSCSSRDTDGIIGYLFGETILVDEHSASSLRVEVPTTTVDGKPLIVIAITNFESLELQIREFAALTKIKQNAPELQTDGVARKEVGYRLNKLDELLDRTLNQTFDLSNGQNNCWILGEQTTFNHVRDFNHKLSEICDQIYHKTPRLWNELINRRQLTSQGTKARRELIKAMVEDSDKESLGLEGYGPEVTMFYSLLKETGIYKEEEGYWGFVAPCEKSNIWIFWEAIEIFCLAAKEKPETLDLLYQKLEAPPYGIKQGAIPIILAAVLLYYADDIGVYKDGTFIPVLGVEHFELLVKEPARFAVKNFEILGLRSQVFKELEAILSNANWKKTGKLRNTTLLTVVTPLYQFVKKLPNYTKQTKQISQEAQAILKALQETTEPDELLFTKLPIICQLPPIKVEEEQNVAAQSASSLGEEIAKTLKIKLIQYLREINTAYDTLLTQCHDLLYEAFGVRSEQQKLREDLRVRARYLVDKCVERSLKSFTKAAIVEDKTDQEWLNALVMIVADKPAESWKDEDLTEFEIKLSDLARKFKNLEALQKETASKGEGFDARRITVTRPDGQETHRLVWVDHKQEDEVEQEVEKILKDLRKDAQFRQAVLARLTEFILGESSSEGFLQFETKQQRKKTS